MNFKIEQIEHNLEKLKEMLLEHMQYCKYDLRITKSNFKQKKLKKDIKIKPIDFKKYHNQGYLRDLLTIHNSIMEIINLNIEYQAKIENQWKLIEKTKQKLNRYYANNEFSTGYHSCDPYLIENLYNHTANLIFEKENSKPNTKEQQ